MSKNIFEAFIFKDREIKRTIEKDKGEILKTTDLYVASFIQLTTKQTPLLKLDANKRIYFIFPNVNDDPGHVFYSDSPIPVASYVATLKALKSRMFNEKEQMGGFSR